MKSENRIVILKTILLIAVCLVCDFGPKANAESEKTTTIILIRHADRDNFFILTEDGRRRAEALLEAVGDMDIKAIYSPDLQRNLDTVKPLAKHLGIDITITPRIQGTVIDQIAKKILARHAGETVLIVGNGSANLRALHLRLGGTGEGPYKYGDLFIYTIPDQGPAKVIKSRFGQ